MLDGNFIRKRVDEVLVPVVKYILLQELDLSNEIAALTTTVNNLSTTLTNDVATLNTTITNDIAALASVYAPINSPIFTGAPKAPTPPDNDDSTAIATTAFVVQKIVEATTGVSAVIGNTGNVTLAQLVTGGLAPLASPALTGTPTAPTATAGDNSTTVATTAFTTAAVASGLATALPHGTNLIYGSTASAGQTVALSLGTGLSITGTTLNATYTYTLPAATAAVLGGVMPDGTTLTNTGGALSVTYGTTANTAAQGNDTRIVGALAAATAASTYAPLNSPVLIGTPTAPTQGVGDNSTNLATTAFVTAAIANSAALDIPAATGKLLGGSGTAGTAAVVTIGTNLSLSSGVLNATYSYTLPPATSTVLGGVKPDGITITNTTGAISVTYGTTANTAAQGNDTRIVGALSATSAAAIYAPLISPALSGSPTSTNPTSTDNSTRVATTSFVQGIKSGLETEITNETNRAIAAEATKGTKSAPNTWTATQTFQQGIVASGVDAGGAQLRLVNGSYGAIFWNDGSSVWLLQTASGQQYGSWNAYRPVSWNLSTGALVLDGTGRGASFGGSVTATGAIYPTAGILVGPVSNPINTASNGFQTLSDGSTMIYSGSRTALSVGGGVPTLMGFFWGTSLVGSITTNGSSITFNPTSDHRVKHDFGLVAGEAGALIDAVPVHMASYRIDNTNAAPRPMFFAHELQRALPALVTGFKGETHPDGTVKPQTIDMLSLTPILWAEQREARQREAAKDALITTLSDKLEDLLKRVIALESK